MALAADHQAVVDGDAQSLGRRPDLARHLDVVAWRLGVTTWMIVQNATVQLTSLIGPDFLFDGFNRGR
jgi:hypothetical protein